LFRVVTDDSPPDVESTVPSFVTHYYRESRQPFLNLSDLGESDLLEIMSGLIAERHKGLQHRLFGRKYMAMRRVTEDRLYLRFVESGGRPERRVPHYFVLGESAWFRGLASDMVEVRLPLAALPVEQTTVTWTDSFTAMEVDQEFDLPHACAPYHGQLFYLADIPVLARRYGVPRVGPDQDYAGNEQRAGGSRFVEVQLWSAIPIREFL